MTISNAKRLKVGDTVITRSGYTGTVVELDAVPLLYRKNTTVYVTIKLNGRLIEVSHRELL